MDGNSNRLNCLLTRNMLPLVIHIERSAGEPAITRAFHESPVRIGRSPFASLRLREPFVSEWQAVVRFHGDRTTYLDLGSRNPTEIDGKPVERNVEVEIGPGTDVRIGTLRLRFERVAAAREDPEQHLENDTAFHLPNQLAKDLPTGTIALKELPDARGLGSPVPPLPKPGPRAANGRRPGAPPPPPPPPPPPASTSADTLASAERKLDDARSLFLEAIKREIDRAPVAERAGRVRALAAHSRRLVEEPAFRNWARESGVDPIELGYVDVGNWLGRLCGSNGAAPKPEHLAVTMERAGQVLELFASAFIDSRRAHQRARQKLGLSQALESKSVLTRSEDPHALLAHLLESSQAAQPRSRELRHMLGDFAMHQIALLSAVVEGARAMLVQLSPHAIHAAPDASVDTGVLEHDPNIAGAWPFAARKLWTKFRVRHHDLTHTDHFARELFGREFTRRYHAIADSASQVERAERT
jgi:predicted component of type VI protein secretion system